MAETGTPRVLVVNDDAAVAAIGDKEADRLHLAVIAELEIPLLEIPNGVAGGIGRRHVDLNQRRGRPDGGLLGGCSEGGGNQQRGTKHKVSSALSIAVTT